MARLNRLNAGTASIAFTNPTATLDLATLGAFSENAAFDAALINHTGLGHEGEFYVEGYHSFRGSFQIPIDHEFTYTAGARQGDKGTLTRRLTDGTNYVQYVVTGVIVNSIVITGQGADLRGTLAVTMAGGVKVAWTRG